MRQLILFVVTAVVLGSCATRKRCNEKFPPKVVIRDSTYETTEYKDTTIYTPADTVTLRDTIECDELGLVNMPERSVRSNQATVRLSIRNNRLQVEARCDSLKMELKKMKSIKIRERIHSEVKIKKEKYIPGFYQFTFWYFIVTGFVILILLIIRGKLI